MSPWLISYRGSAVDQGPVSGVEMGMRVCPVRAHPLRGAGPNMVLSTALFPCQTAATDTSISPDWTQQAQYRYIWGTSLIKMFCDSDPYSTLQSRNVNCITKMRIAQVSVLFFLLCIDDFCELLLPTLTMQTGLNGTVTCQSLKVCCLGGH